MPTSSSASLIGLGQQKRLYSTLPTSRIYFSRSNSGRRRWQRKGESKASQTLMMTTAKFLPCLPVQSEPSKLLYGPLPLLCFTSPLTCWCNISMARRLAGRMSAQEQAVPG